MHNEILTLIGAVFILAGAQSASANDHTHLHSAAQHKTHVNHFSGYVKPGAAVALFHDYDGDTELGEYETVSATLTHIYQDGTLTVTLLAPPDIQISAFSPIRKMPLSQGSFLDIPVQFSSTNPGAFTLSLETVYESVDGQESRRILSIPVNVGGKLLEKTSVSGKIETETASKSGVIGLAAIEVIK